MSFTAGATLLNTATADADGVSHAGDDIITTGSGADTIGGEVASSGSAAATNRAGTTAGTGAAHAGNATIEARKSVVEGKSVSVPLAPGGGRFIHKKT